MWRAFLLLFICAVAMGVVAMFERSWETTIIAIVLVGFALGYIGGLGNKTSEE